MDNLRKLLENHFIYKDEDRELYYSIYDEHNDYRSFLDKLGYQLIIRHDFIRLEKFPAEIDEFMGIGDFASIEEYMLLMLLLMFLEDKSKEDQFLLKDIVEYMEGNATFEVDTTVLKTRRQICHVLKFAKENSLLSVCDGNVEKFMTDAQTQVLYDNTGLSKYFMRNLPIGLSNCNNYEDFMSFVQIGVEKDATSTRRSNVYRNLLLRPVLYNKTTDYDEFAYIKKYRYVVAEDFTKYLGWSLHVQRELAMAVPDDNYGIRDCFPGADGLSGAALIFNFEVRKRVMENKLEVSSSGSIVLDKAEFYELAAFVKKTKGSGFTQSLRNMTPERFAAELLIHLKKFMMCSITETDIVLLPAVAKVVGEYPKSYLAKMEGK